MQKRKRKFLLAGSACLVTIALWMLLCRANPNADEVHRRNLQRYGDFYFRLNDVEHRLGRNTAKRLGLQALQSKYEHKADAERAALLASGYFVKVSATITNLGSRTEEINERFRHIDGDPESLTIFSTQSNHVTVICRPQYAPAYREELQKP
jgi:hypothetical protein